MTKILLIISLIISLLANKYFIDQTINLEHMVDSQVPNIAEKSYITGCFEAHGSECHYKGTECAQQIKALMKTIGSN